ncbi:hypothetical protein SZN_24815 [Streptomyces zinciresistens K42]|uniref:Uncharacterized protein n=1 Tax=Streptomyces zinciresistens K42 TaxID=700597 RepID=G2GHH8_9ACTN|nr:hypothetical protein SZN_24815 [Streptomyces zinciresistens K42]
MRRDARQPVPQRAQFPVPEDATPGPDRLRRRFLGRAGAGPPPPGEHDEPGARVAGVRPPLGLALAHDLVDEPARGAAEPADGTRIAPPRAR